MIGCDSKGINMDTIVKETKEINYKVWVDKLEDSDIVAPLYYYTIKGESKVYLWKDKKLFDSSTKEYVYPFFEVFPSNALNRLEEKLNLSNSIEEEYGQWFFYENTGDYELFIFDCWNNKDSNNKQWQIFFLNQEVKGVTIDKKSEKMDMAGYQATDDAVYIYSGTSEEFIVYKIDVSTLDVEKINVSRSLFKINEVIMNAGQIFIHNDIFLLSTSEYDFENENKKNGVILRYDLNTKKADTIFTDDKIYKVFPYNNGYIVLCRDETYNIYLKYYNQDLNLLKSTKIDIKSKHGDVYVRKYLWQIHNGKLYGTMAINGKLIDFLVIIDIESSEVVYLLELQNKHSKSGYALMDVRYYVDRNGKLINLRSF
jgi:hypothetical protein